MRLSGHVVWGSAKLPPPFIAAVYPDVVVRAAAEVFVSVSMHLHRFGDKQDRSTGAMQHGCHPCMVWRSLIST